VISYPHFSIKVEFRMAYNSMSAPADQFVTTPLANSDLQAVFKDTCSQLRKVRAPKAECWTYSQKEADTVYSAESKYETKIRVVNEDSFVAAAPYADKSPTCVLNMASDRRPGGGVVKGSRAQEEDLCRRSNLYGTLAHKFYPLGPHTVLYSPKVTVIKDPKYKMIDPFRVSVVSMAALRRPALVKDRYTPEDYHTMIRKVRCILYQAALAKQEVLVLGAFGCGVFGNPPTIVATIFRKLLTTEFAGVFREVVFAVLCGKDTTNYDTFAKVFAA
jgi:uncharacterized protein (TIGR02452 family)